MAQILLSVSPAMFEEFEIPYASRWYRCRAIPTGIGT